MSTFSERILMLREASGKNTKEFAEFLGISAGALSSYENGKTTPSGTRLIRISERTGAPTEWLLFGTGGKPPTRRMFSEKEKSQYTENIANQESITSDSQRFPSVPDELTEESFDALLPEQKRRFRRLGKQMMAEAEQAGRNLLIEIEPESKDDFEGIAGYALLVTLTGVLREFYKENGELRGIIAELEKRNRELCDQRDGHVGSGDM
jgi:transcriptional regulator with XRE-family HTH domain